MAELLRTWVQSVVQAVEPWVSSSDIDRGSLWFNQIINELSSTTHGIICITKDNKDKPWILFEAGALAKGLVSSRIYTLLVDLNSEDIKDPLAQFNHTMPTKEGMSKLISSINNGLGENRLKDVILTNAFNTYWFQFEEEYARIIAGTDTVPHIEPVRSQDDILSEILNSVRGIDRRVNTLEVEKNSFVAESLSQSSLARSRPKPTMSSFIIRLLKQGVASDDIARIVAHNYPEVPDTLIANTYKKVIKEIEGE